jgi:hypothetical protein
MLVSMLRSRKYGALISNAAKLRILRHSRNHTAVNNRSNWVIKCYFATMLVSMWCLTTRSVVIAAFGCIVTPKGTNMTVWLRQSRKIRSFAALEIEASLKIEATDRQSRLRSSNVHKFVKINSKMATQRSARGVYALKERNYGTTCRK